MTIFDDETVTTWIELQATLFSDTLDATTG